MRPRLITVPKVLLFLVACAVFGGLAYWIKGGMPLPGSGVPSTAGKIAFISDRNNHNDLWMASADGSGSPVALTDDAADDSQPAWSESGSEITFVSSDRKGVNPQVFIVDAKPNATVLPITNTSSSKDSPFFGAEGLIYYLDAGKLNSGNATATDFDALLPGPDLRLELSDLFSTGGLVRVAVSPDGKRYLGVLKGEESEALLLFETEGEALAVLGYGKRVYPAFRPDGGWAAVFVDGGPLPEGPGILYSDAAVQAATDKQESFVPPKPLPFRPQEGINLLVTWDKSGTMGPPNPLPAAPNALRISPDGKKLALCFDRPAENGKTAASGVVVLSDGGVSAPVQIAKLPATEPTWSPDGSKLAFVSGPDIYTVDAGGGGAPINLTQGKGTNHSPAWSPAKTAAAPKP